MIPSVVVHCLGRTTGWVVAEEPHIWSIGIEFGLDVGGEIVASIDDHPDIRRIKPT